MVEIEIEKPSKGKVIAVEEKKAITPKEGLPTHFSLEEALRLPNEMLKALVAALASLDDHEVQETKNEVLKLQPHEYAPCYAAHNTINLTNEDLLLGSKPHNRHLFIFGYVVENKINRMLLDGRLAISIIPKSTMATIGIKVDELS
ncbi:hypothetical protein ACFX10_043456 [Malus domestica]